MIPANAFTAEPAEASFQAPYNEPYTPLYQRVLGGNAIGDPSAGRQSKDWEVSYSGGQITVKPVGEAVAMTLAASGVQVVSMAFDNNMGIVLAWQTLAGSSLYYYDTVLEGYTTRAFTGTSSCRVCVDDARDFYAASSDVIFGYTQGGTLYWRQQRDRYDIPRTVGLTNKALRRMGPSVTNRLQFELL